MFRGLFSGQKKDPVEAFWEWFQANETRIWKIDQDTGKIYQMIRDALDRVNPALTFEIGMSITDGKRQLFLSDGGNSTFTGQLEMLHQAAPILTRWQIIKHTTTPAARLVTPHADTAAPGEEIRFQLFNDGDKVGILVMFSNYQEAKRDIFARLAPDLLKDAIGFQSYLNLVGFVDYAGPESNLYANARPLAELGKAFEEYYRINRQ
jgi:hypothetical protein